jgi:hypothetical protein
VIVDGFQQPTEDDSVFVNGSADRERKWCARRDALPTVTIEGVVRAA